MAAGLQGYRAHDDGLGRTPRSRCGGPNSASSPLVRASQKKCDGRVLDGVGLWRLLTCPKLHRRRRRGTGEIRWGVQATRKTRGQRDGEGAIPTSDPQPANARPRPALATCDAMCARDPCLRPDLHPAPATVRDSRADRPRLARGIRPRPVNGTCGPSGARVELEPLVRFASRGCGRPWYARAATELDWAMESKAALDTPSLRQTGRGPRGSRGADRPRGRRPARHLWQDSIFCTVAGSCRIVAAQLPDSCRLCFT